MQRGINCSLREIERLVAASLDLLDDCVAMRRTRRFARRQGSWFRRDPRIRWLEGADDPEAELADVEKMMTDKKIGDWDTAVTHYSLTKRAAEPRSAPTPLQMPDMKGLWKNPKLWARNEAYKVIGEMRGGR